VCVLAAGVRHSHRRGLPRRPHLGSLQVQKAAFTFGTARWELEAKQLDTGASRNVAICARFSYFRGKIFTLGRISRRKHEFNISTRQFCTGLFAICGQARRGTKFIVAEGVLINFRNFSLFFRRGKTNAHIKYIKFCCVIRIIFA